LSSPFALFPPVQNHFAKPASNRLIVANIRFKPSFVHFSVRLMLRTIAPSIILPPRTRVVRFMDCQMGGIRKEAENAEDTEGETTTTYQIAIAIRAA
jgi:hypothetical protein